MPSSLGGVTVLEFSSGSSSLSTCRAVSYTHLDLRNLTMSTAEAFRGKRGRDLNELKGAIRSAVSNYLFKATKRSPMVLPVITRL